MLLLKCLVQTTIINWIMVEPIGFGCYMRMDSTFIKQNIKRM
ncbi:hypothetical protein CFP56_031316 [Quercus suber]|uniref:Uncharacterized protein n=1 Tax=Quercus suber TaxID=58331 RepID=A0AAW0JL36_QUESU